jgi:hypothetical protein
MVAYPWSCPKARAPEVCDSAMLGKLEHKFKEGIFIMPKVYYLESSDGFIVTKCKGYPGKLTKNQYLELLGGKSLEFTVKRWNRSLRASKIQIQRGIPYQLSPTFKKRVKILNNGLWQKTAPVLGQPRTKAPIELP